MSEQDFNLKLHEFELAKEEKRKMLMKKITSWLPTFILIGIAIWWIFYGTVEITSFKLSLVDQVGLTICTIVFALSFTTIIAEGGFKLGKSTDQYKEAEKENKAAQLKGMSKQKQIIRYATEIAQKNLYEMRKNNLQQNGMKYEDYFDQNGDVIPLDIKSTTLTRHQKRVLKKCINAKINIPNLFGSISNKFFGLKKEVSLKEYQTKTGVKRAAIRIVISFFSAAMIFNFIGFNLGGLIYAFFQIAMWSASGYIQKTKNFNFVIDELLPQLDDKTFIINSFMSLTEQEQSKYDDNKEVEDNA